MPFDGSGNYTPASAPNFPAISGDPISSTYYNAVINDIATALSNTLTRDGQGKPSGAIGWNNQNLTGVAAFASVSAAISAALTVGTTLGVTGLTTTAGLQSTALVESTVGGFKFPDATTQITAAFGTVTSVAIDPTTTGLTFGGPITSSGTFTVAGVLTLAHGGTGASTAAGARVNLLPAFTGKAGQVLTVNVGETDADWVPNAAGTVYAILAANFTTTSATAVDVTGLTFTPIADTLYDVEAILHVKFSVGTALFKFGVLWPTGLTVGQIMIELNNDAALNDPAGSTNSQSWEVSDAGSFLSSGVTLQNNEYHTLHLRGTIKAGATPSGAFKLQVASDGTRTATVRESSRLSWKVVV